MPEQAGYGPRVVRRGGRGGGYRYNDYGGRRRDVEPRSEKDVVENGDYESRDRPQRRRYPRYMDPAARRGRGGYRGGGGRRGGGVGDRDRGDADETDERGGQDRDEPRQQRQPRRRRTRTMSSKNGQKGTVTDSAREQSGTETDGHHTDGEGAGTDGEGGSRSRKKNVAGADEGRRGVRGGKGERRRRSRPRPPPRQGRIRRSRLPKVYTPAEFNAVKEPVEKLSKRLGDKKEIEEEELDEAIKDLVKYFEESEIKNPYELALKMLMVAAGVDNFNALFTPILRALDLVLRGEDSGKEDGLTPEVQAAAFVLSRLQELASCADELAALYELKGAGGEKLKGFVQALLKFHLYRQALNEVIENELEKEFSIEEVIIPLMIQHHIQPIEDMLKKNPYYLEPLVRYLDKVVGLSYADMSAEVEKYDVPYVIGLGRQFLVRVILGWQGEFKFNLEWCSNIKLFFAKTHLYYLNRRRFRVSDLPFTNWMELVRDLVDDNPGLARELVDELVRYDQSPEAKYWADRYSVKDEEMAEPVIKALADVKEEFDIKAAECTQLKVKEGKVLYESDLSDDAIKFVDTEDGAAKLFDELNEKGQVGLDVEWKPDTGVLPSPVSVLQLATADNVYVLDVNALKSGKALVDGLNKLLLNESLVKLGFNIGRDIGLLERALGAELKFKEAVHVVDLRVLQDRFYSGRVDFLFPDANRRDFKRRMYNSYEYRQVRGLNSLVRAVFGKNLDRVELMSNWDNRPLRQSQLRFAATDAHVLIRIYDRVSEEAKKNEKDLEELLSKPVAAATAGGRGGARGDADGGADSADGGDHRHARGGGEDEGTDSGGDRTGDESGRSSRNYGRGPRGPPRAYGGGPYRGRGGGGRGFRGGRGGSGFRGPPRPRLTRDHDYPPASQKEEILVDGKKPEIMSSLKKPKELKIVTDSMLHGLGKALQERGFDVVVMRREDRHTDCVDRSKKEDRVILTQGRVFYEMKDQVDPGYCFKVVNRKVSEQVEEVLEAYQVQLDEDKAAEKENNE